MHQSQINNLLYWQFANWQRPGLAHAILGRHGGISPAPFASLNLSSAVRDEPAHYEENRRRAYGVLGRTVDTLVHAHLVHGAEVAQVGTADHGRAMPRVDGLITNEIGCGLTMNYADCAPILVYDPQHHAIGLGHAGWGGTVADVPGALVRAMQAAFGSKPEALLGAIGPCISAAVYEVDEPVISAVRRAFPDHTTELLIPQAGGSRPHFDLRRANQLNFARAGVEDVVIAPFCTAQNNDLFFSHRAELGQTGRFGVIVTLEKRT